MTLEEVCRLQHEALEALREWCYNNVAYFPNIVGSKDHEVAEAEALDDQVAEALGAFKTLKPPRAERIQVIIALEGGIVQGGAASQPVELSIVDYDERNPEENDNVRAIPQGDGTTVPAAYYELAVLGDPAWVKNVLEAVKQQDAEIEAERASETSVMAPR